MKWGRTNKGLAKCYDQAAPDNAICTVFNGHKHAIMYDIGALKAYSLKVFQSVSSYILKLGTAYRL
jgi:hypothetical protein